MAIETLSGLSRNAATRIGYRTTLLSTAAGTFVNWRAAHGTTLQSTEDSTGQGRVTVQYPVDDRIGFLVSWCCTAASTEPATLTVAQGSLRRGYKRDQGSLSITLSQNVAGSASTGTTGTMFNRFLIGPLESARFAIKSESTIHAPEDRNFVSFTLSTDSTGVQARRASIYAFRMPVVGYDT